MKTNRKWKQCTAVVMSLILIATMSQWLTIVKAADTVANQDWDGGLIQNGNFADWTGEFPAGYAYNDNIKASMERLIDEEKGYVAKITNENNINELFFECDVAVEEGKTYELSFDASYSGSSANAQAVYIVYNSNYSEMHSIADYISIVNGAWSRVEATFDATTNETVHIRFALWNGGTDAILKLTNLRLQAVGEDNLIPNGTFTKLNAESTTGYSGWEMGSDAYTGQKKEYELLPLAIGHPGEGQWYVQGKGESNVAEIVDVGDAQHGALHVKQNSDATTEIRYEFPTSVETGTYTVSLKIKGTVVNDFWSLILYAPYGGTDFRPLTLDTSKTTYSDWTELTGTVQFTTNPTGKLLFGIWFNGPIGNGTEFYIDDLKIYDAGGKDVLEGKGSFEKAVEGENIVKNTPTIAKISNANIEGIQFGGGHFCYLATNTIAPTIANATYVLKMNAALSGTGTVDMLFINTDNYNTDYKFTVQTSNEVTTQRVLIPFTNSAVYEMRATLLNADENSLFSFGNVSLKLNRGDFDEDNDGYPDADDFSQMRKVLVGSEEATENAKTFAEMNADEKVDVLDLVRMKLYGAQMK